MSCLAQKFTIFFLHMPFHTLTHSLSLPSCRIGLNCPTYFFFGKIFIKKFKRAFPIPISCKVDIFMEQFPKADPNYDFPKKKLFKLEEL